jgi:DNA-binding NarL/FixJ family response regulator
VAEDATSDSAHASSGQEPASQGNARTQPITDDLTVIRDSPSVRNPIVSIGVIDEHWFTRECITRSLNEFDESLHTVSFRSCEDCLLRSTRDLDLIVYHMHQAPLHNYNDNNGSFKKLLKIASVIILSEVDNPFAILTALENGARGYIPTTITSLEQTIEIIRLVKAGGTFVPASSLSIQRNNGEYSTSRATTTERFTPRQMAVLHYLKSGKANKTIARELALSEGTVKAHIRNIMKKMGVTNRTEVACRAQALATFGAT